MTDPTVDLQPLVERLRACVGDEHVITQRHQLRTYESDGLLHYAVTPGAVVLAGSAEEVRGVVRACHDAQVPFVARRAAVVRPGSAEEVRGVVRACHDAKVPYVARGAGSGHSGGALPVSDGIVIA